MRALRAGSAIMGAAVAAIVLTALPAGSVSEARSCAPGTVHTVYEATHRCLSTRQQARIHRMLARLRKRGASRPRAIRLVARHFRVAPETVLRIERGMAGPRPVVAPEQGSAVPLPTRLDDPPRSPATQGAHALTARADCTTGWPRRAVAALRWTPAPDAATQRVVVTIYGDGFETGRFEISGPLPAGAAALDWYGIRGQAIHLWRVLTLSGGLWTSSATASFEGPTCTVDQQPML